MKLGSFSAFRDEYFLGVRLLVVLEVPFSLDFLDDDFPLTVDARIFSCVFLMNFRRRWVRFGWKLMDLLRVVDRVPAFLLFEVDLLFDVERPRMTRLFRRGMFSRRTVDISIIWFYTFDCE